MTENEFAARANAPQAGDSLFEAFVEQVKQALEHLYDFAALQQHPLARYYDQDSDLSAKSAGHKLRYDLIKAIEALKPQPDLHFRDPVARLYNILHLYYVEGLNIQVTAAELGLSERQAYRDLRRGQERVAAVLWNNRLPPPPQQDDFSLESEVARLRLSFNPVDIGEVFQQATRAIEKLAQQQSVQLGITGDAEPMMLSTDAALAHQIMVSLLSHIVQQMDHARLQAAFASDSARVTLTLSYVAADGIDVKASFATVIKLAERLRWQFVCDDSAAPEIEIVLRMTSQTATIFIIDDNQGWVDLLERFLEGYNYLVVSASGGQDIVEQAQELNPALIILDVMMPERDGWELLQRLRARPATAQTPILVCTVFNDAQLAYSLGATGFVSKPANREQILAALEQIAIS